MFGRWMGIRPGFAANFAARRFLLEVPQGLLDRVGRAPEGVRDDVAVGIHGQADLGVAEDLHDHSGVDALLEEQACGGVPEVVQPDPSQTGPGQQCLEGPVVVARMDRSAGAGGEDEAAVMPLLACRFAAVRLALLVRVQRLDDSAG